MSEDGLRALGGSFAGETGNEVATEALDFVAKLAREELERRHPGLGQKKAAPVTRGIRSDELDAQVPAATVPFEGIEE